MILDFETYCLNEKSVKGIKKILKGSMSSSDRIMMKKLLKKHIVYFLFKKKNGDLRKAVGTLISSYLPALRGGAPKPEHQMVYYDLDKKHWRSFRSYSFIKILNVKSEDDYLGKKPKHLEDDEEEKKKDIHKEKEEKEEKKHDSEKYKHDSDKHDKHEEKEDTKKKEYKVGEKIPEKELMRRSTDFRKGSRKNEFTKKSNDAKKKGDLDKEDDEEDED